MAIVFTIVGEAAAWRRESSYEVGILDTGCLEFLPKEGSPTALFFTLLFGSPESDVGGLLEIR